MASLTCMYDQEIALKLLSTILNHFIKPLESFWVIRQLQSFWAEEGKLIAQVNLNNA